MILFRRIGLYNHILCTPLRTPKEKQNEPRQKQIGSTSENLWYMGAQKFRNLDLNEKRDGAATTWYGSSFHIKGNLQKEYLKTLVRN